MVYSASEWKHCPFDVFTVASQFYLRMAGADTAKVKAEYENIVVPEDLIRGGKFIKWEQVG